MHQLDCIAKHSAFIHNIEWTRTRNIEFSNYSASVNSMNGKQNFKKLKKPTDLYKLQTDTKEIGLSGKAAESAIDSLIKQ